MPTILSWRFSSATHRTRPSRRTPIGRDASIGWVHVEDGGRCARSDSPADVPARTAESSSRCTGAVRRPRGGDRPSVECAARSRLATGSASTSTGPHPRETQRRMPESSRAGSYEVRHGDFLAMRDLGNADLVISSMVLEHLDEDATERFFELTRSLLGPSGSLILMVPGSPRPLGCRRRDRRSPSAIRPTVTPRRARPPWLPSGPCRRTDLSAEQRAPADQQLHRRVVRNARGSSCRSMTAPCWRGIAR